MGVLVICSNPKCDTAFWSNLVAAPGPGDKGTATFTRVGVGECPECGHPGFIPDGRYSSTSVTLFRKDQWQKIATALQLVAKKIEAGDTTDAAIDEVVNEPWLADYLKGFIPRDLKDLVACTKILSWTAIVATAAYHGNEIANVPSAVADILNGIKAQSVEPSAAQDDTPCSTTAPLSKSQESLPAKGLIEDTPSLTPDEIEPHKADNKLDVEGI